MSVQPLTRRSAITGGLVAAVAAVAGFVVARNSSAAQAKPGTAAANGYGPSTSGGSGSARLAALDQIPAGGGLVVAQSDVVLVRSASGDVAGLLGDLHPPGLPGGLGPGRHDQLPVPRERVRRRHGRGRLRPGRAARSPRSQVVVRDGGVYTA